ncbi:ricin B lectin domain-containing protein [Gloeopeniophorella convolvens]|nr:ricin B lectin domain-containing protein [Gloeopeniophorella convolvens]
MKARGQGTLLFFSTAVYAPTIWTTVYVFDRIERLACLADSTSNCQSRYRSTALHRTPCVVAHIRALCKPLIPHRNMTLTPGALYVLINVKSNIALDLSASNDHSVVGYDFHDGDNQKWTLMPGSNGLWIIRNSATGKLLAFEGNEPRDGAPLVSVEETGLLWDISPAGSSNPQQYRIQCGQNTSFCVDFSDHGNTAPGTPVTLWRSYPDSTNQMWNFLRVDGPK